MIRTILMLAASLLTIGAVAAFAVADADGNFNR